MTDNPLLSRGARRGTEAAKEGAGKANSSRMYDFFSLKPNTKIVTRILSEPWEWLTVDVHSMYPTKPAPTDNEGNWPEKMSPVCRRTKLADDLPMYEDCYCCEHPQLGEKGRPRRPSSRTFALAILREEVKGDGTPELGGPEKKGKRLGFRDAKREVSITEGETTETKEVPHFLLIEMGWKNFWSKLEGFSQVYDSITDREYVITRVGEGMNDTDYQVAPLDKLGTYDVADPEVLQKKYGITVSGVDEDGRSIKNYPEYWSLPHIVNNRASEEFYARFIDPNKTVSEKGVEKKTSSPEVASTVSLEAMKARITRMPQADSQEVPQEAESVPQDVPTSVPTNISGDLG